MWSARLNAPTVWYTTEVSSLPLLSFHRMADVPLPFRGKPPSRETWVLRQEFRFSPEQWIDGCRILPCGPQN